MINYQLLVWSLEELADEYEQTMLWNGLREGEMSTFDEATCGVFDDSRLAHRLDDGTLSAIAPPEFCAKAEELHRALHRIYSLKLPSDREVILHPIMAEVRNLSRDLLTIIAEHGLLTKE